MGSVNSPLSSCLVGIPFKIHEPSPPHPFAGKWPALPTAEEVPAWKAWEGWTKALPKFAPETHETMPKLHQVPHSAVKGYEKVAILTKCVCSPLRGETNWA